MVFSKLSSIGIATSAIIVHPVMAEAVQLAVSLANACDCMLLPLLLLLLLRPGLTVRTIRSTLTPLFASPRPNTNKHCHYIDPSQVSITSVDVLVQLNQASRFRAIITYGSDVLMDFV